MFRIVQISLCLIPRIRFRYWIQLLFPINNLIWRAISFQRYENAKLIKESEQFLNINISNFLSNYWTLQHSGSQMFWTIASPFVLYFENLLFATDTFLRKVEKEFFHLDKPIGELKLRLYIYFKVEKRMFPKICIFTISYLNTFSHQLYCENR